MIPTATSDAASHLIRPTAPALYSVNRTSVMWHWNPCTRARRPRGSVEMTSGMGTTY